MVRKLILQIGSIRATPIWYHIEKGVLHTCSSICVALLRRYRTRSSCSDASCSSANINYEVQQHKTISLTKVDPLRMNIVKIDDRFLYQ